MPAATLLDRLESRFGHLAIPGIHRILAGFQFLCFVLLLINQEFYGFLALDGGLVMKGEVWRLFTFLFIPRTLSIIWIIFVIMIVFFIGDRLEAEWGKFRLNLYVAGTTIGLWLSELVLGIPIGPAAPELLYSSLFLAFAAVDPNAILNLYGLIPFKAKWLGWINAIVLALMCKQTPSMTPGVLLALVPFFVYFIPRFVHDRRHGARVQSRRAEYKASSLPATEHFHECKVCGRTDVTNPELLFRIAGDDDEYCEEHLPTAP